MIPGTFVEPLPAAGSARRRGGLVLLLAGTLLLGMALVGGFAWWFSYSPFGFLRVDASANGRISDLSPGTYLVYEERAGASQPDLPPAVVVAITDRSGGSVPTDALIDPGERDNPFAYRTPWHEGRAIARFVVDEGGQHHIAAVSVPSSARPGGYAGAPTRTLAVGREASATWLGGLLGAVVLCAVPLVLGTILVIWGRRRSRATAPARSPRDRGDGRDGQLGRAGPSGPPGHDRHAHERNALDRGGLQP